MPAWHAYSYAFGPVVAAVGICLLVLILRWGFGRKSSVVAGPPRSGRADQYGLLAPVLSPSTYVEGEIARRRLEDAGINSTLASTLDGPRVMVWPADVDKAKTVLAT